jgi:hypothetical protein
MRRNVEAAVGYDHVAMDLSPTKVDQLAVRVNELLDRSTPIKTVQAFFKSMNGCLQGPHMAQCFLSALLCKMVFKSPEPMCQNQHPIQTMRYYNLIRQTGM